MHADAVQQNAEGGGEESIACLMALWDAEVKASTKRKLQEKEEKKEKKRQKIKFERKKHRELMKEVRAHRRSMGLKPTYEPPAKEKGDEDEEPQHYDYDNLHLAFKFEDH